KGVRQPAIRWLLDVFTSSMQEHNQSAKVAGFRIDNEQVRELLKLPARSGHLYSWNEFAGHTKKLVEEAMSARKKEPAERTPYEAALLDLTEQAAMYGQLAQFETPHKVFYIENDQLLNLLNLEKRPGDYHYSFAEFLPRVSVLLRTAQQAQARGAQSQSLFEAK